MKLSMTRAGALTIAHKSRAPILVKCTVARSGSQAKHWAPLAPLYSRIMHHAAPLHLSLLSPTRRAAGRAALWAILLIAAAWTAAPLGAQPSYDTAELRRRGQSAQVAGQWDEAIAHFSALLKVRPRDADAMAASGYSHYKKGDLDMAEKLYRQALTVNNRHAAAGYGLGQIAMARKDWAEAAGLFRDVLRVAPAYEPLRTRHNLALSLFTAARYAEASQVFEEALAQPAEGHYAQFYLDAVDNELARENYLQAAQWGAQGTRRYPQDAWLWDKLAWALKMCRDAPHAREAYDRAEALVYQDITPVHRTVLSLPFRGKWRVVQGNGGQSSHRGLGARFAWDFEAVTESGRTRTGVEGSNSDYYSFGQEILAPADGRVVALQDGTPDNSPYHRTASPHSGNYVLIEHAPGELSSLGHLQNGSIEVKVGQQVRRGQRVARCGNSGRATLPHLHYSFIGLYNGKRISQPAQFSHYSVLRDGESYVVERGVPRENSIVDGGTPVPLPDVSRPGATASPELAVPGNS